MLQVLDRYFLEARSKLLDLAAILDRIDRGAEASALCEDPRVMKLHRAISALDDKANGRAQRIQEIFSLEYNPDWERPAPKA